jgi:hypothetical protein
MMDRKVTSAKEVRDHVIDVLRRELVGPSPGFPAVQLNGEEILRPQDPPRYRYSSGILFPGGVGFATALGAIDEVADIEATQAVEEDPSVEDVPDQPEISSGMAEDKVADTDVEVDPSAMFLPSTMGLSFLVDPVDGITLSASWGTYDKETVKGFPTFSKDGIAKDPDLWFRSAGSISIDLSASQLGTGGRLLRLPRQILADRGTARLEADIVSRPWADGRRLVTVTMINTGTVKRPVNENCFFQCAFSILLQGASAILPYPERPPALQDEEERTLALLYRHRPNYAVGHGCAADWAIQDGKLVRVRTEVLPVFEQAPVVPIDTIPMVQLSMKVLAEAPAIEIAQSFRALAAAYRQWIVEREQELAQDASLPRELRECGEANLRECKACLVRIEDGIDLLMANDDAMEAFKLMNRAMVEQRAHYALASEETKRRHWAMSTDQASPSAPYAQPDYPTSTQWRPFQLAFVLMNVRSFVDPEHAERSLVDVIWFPTGGGKTEAYLGLAGFVILLGRMTTPDDAGTKVLMRYTLRLLTTQQFQRAASLICALELYRRKDPARLGTTPISIGLWVGGAVTPNKNEQALIQLGQVESGNGENPFIVLSCPWCGIDMGPQDYGPGTRVFGYKKSKDASGERRVRFQCEDADCPFSTDAGLPLTVIDEEIYRQPPTLLIGTVDKFAMMPWNPESRAVFGIDAPLAQSPPQLVIQDELHLISGPLGSMVGHYETVIDEFCTDTRKGRRIPAKIIASTATIARARQQIRAVYGRPSALFPPQGLVAGQSFFAREASDATGRVYVGVLATAVPSHVTAQVRVLSTLLQAPMLLENPGGKIDPFVDPYWTLVVYFNSLRELGRASTLVQADIREYLNAMWDRIGVGLLHANQAGDRRRFINHFDELTSRMRSTDIPAVLQKLFTERPKKETVDLCYATNMIQVGLDVPRLSIMSIVGQPKGASEYIQASSRVGRGRDKPGLVVTNFNPFKPRDRSHFESFRPFHENAYRHVEATSVTPFSIPVCDRAIHALAIAIARFRFPTLRSSPYLGLKPEQRDEITRIIVSRVENVDKTEVVRAKAALDLFLDDWNRTRPQEYGDLSGKSEDPLIWPAGKALRPDLNARLGIIRPTATSMRNVDADCEALPIPVYTSGDGE